MDLQKSTGRTITNGLCGICVSDHQHRVRQNVCGQEAEQIQDHAISNAQAKKRKKSAQENSRRCGQRLAGVLWQQRCLAEGSGKIRCRQIPQGDTVLLSQQG